MTKIISAAALVAGASALAYPRAVQSFRPRADGADPTKILADLQKSWADFQAGLDEQIKSKADPLIDAKVEKINTAVGELQGAIDKLNIEAAARALNAERGPGKKPLTAEQKAYGEAFRTYAQTGHGEQALKDLAVKASMSVGSDPDGGYLVPFEMDPTIDRVQANVNGVRSIARVVNLTKGDRWKKLVNLGGSTANWVAEKEARAATSTPTLSEIEIVANEIEALPAATQQLLDDGDVEGWINDEVTIAFNDKEGVAFVSGTGVKQPQGLLTPTIVANASYAWGSIGYIASGGAAGLAAATPDNALIDLTQAIKVTYRGNANWLMNRASVGTVRKIKDTTGQPIWQPSTQMGQPSALLGYPVTEDDNMPDVGSNTYPIAFGDFRRAYAIVDRVGIRVLRDPFTSKPNVLFYTTKRVGGGVINFEAYKVLKIAVS